MFIAEVLQLIHQGDLVDNCATWLQKRESNIVISRQHLDNWKKMSDFSSDDIRNINDAFFSHIKSEIIQLLVLGNSDSWQNNGKAIAKDFIKLLLPLPVSDVAERIKVEFLRQDMFARVSCIFSKINNIMMQKLEDADVSDNNCESDFSALPCPLDSARIFSQFLNNHINDCNWQKVLSSRNPHMCHSWQNTLLEIEYSQCQYTPGDPDYIVFENKYRELTVRIEADYTTSPMCCNTGATPWMIRNILKPNVQIVMNNEIKRWTWQNYRNLKDVVNGKTPVQQSQEFWQHWHKAEAFYD